MGQQEAFRTHPYGPPPQAAAAAAAQAQPQRQGLVPGMHVQPGPMSWVVATKFVRGQKVVVAHIEHQTGSTILPMAPEVARRLGEQLIQAGTGIEVATETPSGLQLPGG